MNNILKLLLIFALLNCAFLDSVYSQFTKEEEKVLKQKEIPIESAKVYRELNKDFPIEMILTYEAHNQGVVGVCERHYGKLSPAEIRLKVHKYIAPEIAVFTSKELYEKVVNTARLYRLYPMYYIYRGIDDIKTYAQNKKLSQVETDKLLKGFVSSKYSQRFSPGESAFFTVNGLTPELVSSYPEYLSSLEVFALASGRLKSDYYKVKLKKPNRRLTIHYYGQKHPSSDGKAKDRYELLDTGAVQYDLLKALYRGRKTSKYVFSERESPELIDIPKKKVISQIDNKTDLFTFLKKAKIDPSDLKKQPTDKQKGLLYVEGASRVYYMVNKKRTYLFAAEKSEEDQLVKKAIMSAIEDYRKFALDASGGFYYFLKTYYIYGYRETITINNIIDKANTYKFSDCALVFGSAHDFKKYQRSLLNIENVSPWHSLTTEEKTLKSSFQTKVFQDFDQQKAFVLKLLNDEVDNTTGVMSTEDLTKALIYELRWSMSLDDIDLPNIRKLVKGGAELNYDRSRYNEVPPLKLVVRRCCNFNDDVKELVKFLIASRADKSDISIMDANEDCGGERLAFIKFLIEECGIKIHNLNGTISYFKSNPKVEEKDSIINYLLSLKTTMPDAIINDK